MTRRLLTSTMLFAAAIGLAACEFQKKTTTTSPSILVPSPVVPSLVGTWSSTESVSTTATSGGVECTSFVWTVTSQTDIDTAGTFSAVCFVGINMTGTGTGHINGSTVTMSLNGTGTLPGLPTACPFSVNGTGTIDGEVIRVPYTGSTCLGPVSGTQTLRRSLIQPPPPSSPAPPPPPPPSPPPPPTNPSVDVLFGATVLNSPSDLATWPITTTLTQLDISSDGVHPVFSKQDGPGQWPEVQIPGWGAGGIQFTLGMCLNIGGRWYCSAVVEFWPGLPASGGPPSGFAEHWFYDPVRWAPMTGHQPAVGETIGFFVCAGDCRNNTYGTLSPVRERSNVVLVPMPGAGGASFHF